MVDVIGLIAASLTTFSFLPQAIKVIKTKSTSDLSPLMYATFVLGVLLWLCYGLLKQDIAIILANSVTIVLSGIVFFYVLKNYFKANRGG